MHVICGWVKTNEYRNDYRTTKKAKINCENTADKTNVSYDKNTKINTAEPKGPLVRLYSAARGRLTGKTSTSFRERFEFFETFRPKSSSLIYCHEENKRVDPNFKADTREFIRTVWPL